MTTINERAAQHEPAPVKTGGSSIQDLVIADMEARKQVGLQRYGTLLQANNGRDALMDLYQEILDAANYCRQELEERQQSRVTAEQLVDLIRPFFHHPNATIEKKALADFTSTLTDVLNAARAPAAPR